MSSFGWGLAAAVTAGVLGAAPLLSGETVLPVNPDEVQALGEVQGDALLGAAEHFPRLDAPRTQPQPRPERVDESHVLTPGVMTGVENGWARIKRGPGRSVHVELLNPRTGEVQETLSYLRADQVPEGIRTGAENGWARLTPMKGGWVRAELLDPQTGEPTKNGLAPTGARDDGLTPGLVVAEENGWAKVRRGDGYTEVDLLDPATGAVLQTVRLVREGRVPQGFEAGVEQGWIRLVPVGDGWARVELLDPTAGQPAAQPSTQPMGPPAKSTGFIKKL